VTENQGTAARNAKASPHQPTVQHGRPQRGLESTATSHLLQGKFGRLFRNLPAAQFGSTPDQSEHNLHTLALAMLGTSDPPKDGPDDEESGIPALYTYFGQFVDHDITFDPASSLQKQNDPNALIDYRTPAFDLDNVYGRGPDDQPYMYTPPPEHQRAENFLLGEPIHGVSGAARDLPRNHAHPPRALIGDPRNDENAIVSQLQGLFLRFHNRIAADSRLPFEEVQQLVRFHYQYVVLNDFLPRIVQFDVLKELKSDDRYDREKLKFFRWKNDPFMPVEFSVAAYRLGHSMVRPGYRLNDDEIHPIFPKHGSDNGLFGFRAMNPHWAIDWARFIDTETRSYSGSNANDKRRLQFAYKIDTLLVQPLRDVSKVVSGAPPSLPERNLLRGYSMGLPSGQAVARAMSIDPLEDKDILIGNALKTRNGARKPINEINRVFEGNCPLWTYILAEAMQNAEDVPIPVKEKMKVETPKLGPVGGRIVAEVFLGLMFGDPNSLLRLDPLWHPQRPQGDANFALKDFVKYALG
jgi:hypothetical protein